MAEAEQRMNNAERNMKMLKEDVRNLREVVMRMEKKIQALEDKSNSNTRLKNPPFLDVSAKLKDKREEILQTNEISGKVFDEVSNLTGEE